MSRLVVGIDVGATAKGYHAVALRGGALAGKFHTRTAAEMAGWCVAQRAAVVAVDAPCCWRATGQPARSAERGLAADGISCFVTPTEEKARGHGFYAWMIAGRELYEALAAHYPVYTGKSTRTRVCIETFPQAVACALAGHIVAAKNKAAVRRHVLRCAGLDPASFANTDEIDAALCAVAARAFLAHDAKFYGDAMSGYIVVPTRALPGFGSDTLSA